MTLIKHIDISEVLISEEFMKALTGTTVSQFYHLVSRLEIAFPSTEDEYTELPGNELKVFFILFYLKFYPNQKLAAFIFRITPTRIDYWVYKLKFFVPQAMIAEQEQLKTPISSIGELVDLVPEIIAICDTEHLLQKPALLDCLIGKFLGPCLTERTRTFVFKRIK